MEYPPPPLNQTQVRDIYSICFLFLSLSVSHSRVLVVTAKCLMKCVGGCAGTGNNTQKTVAIVVGGVAGLGLVIACLLVLKSAVTKKEGKY